MTIGIFGVITDIPQMVKEEVDIKDAITIAKNKINELRPQVDILVMLLNASKPQAAYKAISDFDAVDYVFSSR